MGLERCLSSEGSCYCCRGLDSVPSTHIKQLTIACNSNSRGSYALSKGTPVYTHIPHNNRRKYLLTPDRAQTIHRRNNSEMKV